MVENLGDLRRAVEADKARKRVRQGYSADVRERVVAYARVQRARGASWKSLGRRLGIAATTLRRYVLQASCREAGRARTDEAEQSGVRERTSERPAVAPVPVTVSLPTAVRAPMALALVSPAGFRLEGLDLDGAAQLLRYLG